MKEQGDLPNRLAITDFLKLLSDNLGKVENMSAQGIATIANTLGRIGSPTYREAVDELHSVVKKHGKILVLVDSIEKYEFDDTIVLAVLNALTTLCTENLRNNSCVQLKMAAPSELISKLSSINAEKLSGKTVYIRWSHRDLKAFIAVRVYKYVNRIDTKVHVEFADALKFFDEYYDDVCLTRHNILFPTFPYCMAYTQKEPRQILFIFNSWIHFEELYPEKKRMDLINHAMAYDDVWRVKGALSIYSSVHPKMFEMFERTFLNRPYCFSEAEFDQWINTCSNMRGKIDAYDLKKYYSETKPYG